MKQTNERTNEWTDDVVNGEWKKQLKRSDTLTFTIQSYQVHTAMFASLAENIKIAIRYWYGYILDKSINRGRSNVKKSNANPISRKLEPEIVKKKISTYGQTRNAMEMEWNEMGQEKNYVC